MNTKNDPQDHRTVLTRRRLLSGMSALTVALTSPIWRTSTVFGADASTPGARRFIGVFSANGTIASEFFPNVASGTALSAANMGRIIAPLAAHASKLLVLKGVHMYSTVTDNLGSTTGNKPGGPHMKGPGAMLTGGSLLPGSFPGAQGPAGYADRQSVDQLIADRIGTTSTFKSLEFGVRVTGGHPLDTISYAGASLPNVPVNDPVQMYTRMFANASLSTSQLTQLLADRKSVLDFVTSDITALESRFTSDDKARLDAHLTGIRTMEQQLSSASSGVTCTPPTKPTTFSTTDEATFAPIAQVQMDLMLLAHVCGLTKVSTFMFANADSWQYYPFAGVNEEHHGTSHLTDPASIEALTVINTWHGTQINYMLDKLAATQESDGSNMLDNTILLWGNELGVGNTHDYKNIPWLLAGGGNAGLKTGRSLQFSDLPHNNLMVSICNAMGFADVTTFGIPGCCTGALPNLTA